MCEEKTEDERCCRYEVEAELPEERVQGPERHERAQPRGPSRAKRPDSGDAEELKRDHQKRIGSPGAPTADPRLESEERDCSGRILRVRVVTVQKRSTL